MGTAPRAACQPLLASTARRFRQFSNQTFVTAVDGEEGTASYRLRFKDASGAVISPRHDGPIFWNYGMFPQTWEDPSVVHSETKFAGDNDPLDVVEIGSASIAQGAIEPVKVLGVLAMIDDGELDWKVIAIRAADPLAAELNDIGDVDTKCPGVISGIREWFRWYKTPDGKPLNAFGFEERALDKKHAMEVVAETHAAWKKLVEGKTDKGKLWLK